ncbi:alpha-2-macroglobulin [Bacteroides sp. 51]|uniref:alpha-2-macroglobulin family protein n=1 Tax=Bacteroides sp. 51 TaxID=2302938 RepID=UPI0013D018FF|nr:alpha-2-macroglobulin family protein [Bacteroides sp. 51]NDV84264.1 alpha-2-macroglobulin [Bacteroides sp. 51]
MKTRSSGILVLMFLFVFSMTSFAGTYDKLWKEVEKAQNNGLPQTAIKYTEDIFRKAEAEKNSGQMLKAYTARAGYRQSIAPDSFYVDLKKLEQWATTTTIPEDCAVLHTLIAKTYSDYASQNQYNLLWRTDVVDTPSDDMREWSKNQFVQKVLDHSHAALEDSVHLFALSTQKYIPFVKQQEYSRYYHHNVYHLLASYAVGSMKNISALMPDTVVTKEIADVYLSLNKMYRKQDNKDALVLLALEGLEWRKGTGGISSDTYLTNIGHLITLSGSREVIVEAYLAKARELFDRNKKTEALQVCKDVIAKYPKYERINAVKELQEQILSPSLSVNMPAIMYPGDTLSLRVYHTNLDGFSVHLYKVDLPGSSPLLADIQKEQNRKKYTKKISSQHFNLVRPVDYLQADTVCRLVTPQEGTYLVEIVPDKATTTNQVSQLLSVTRLTLLSRTLPNNRFEAVVLDSKSGQPVADATVQLFTINKGNRILSKSVTSNADGRAELDWNTEYRHIGVEKGTDNGYAIQWVRRGGYIFSDQQTENQVITLLTDRSLYRPGQTVYLKGIVYNQLSDTANVVAGKEYTVSLLDANNREINKATLRTNDFGSFTTEFVLPSGGLNGVYSLRAEDTWVSFRVEEYKRPTFEITLNKPEGSYKTGDAIKLTGLAKTYSGVPVQELPVQYVVTRSMYGWWGQYYNANTTIDSGEAQLNDAGEFTLPITLKPDKDYALDYGYYIFSISATITNVAGETQTTTTTVAAGNRSLLLSVDMPGLMNKDEDIKLTFNARNLNNQPVSVKGEYKLYPFTDYKSGKLAKDPAYTGTFTSNTNTTLTEWKSLPSGVYKLMLTAKDEQGREATYEAETVLFSLNDKSPAKKVGIWYYGINTQFDASQSAEFIFGTSDKDAYVLMDVFSGTKRLESRSLRLSDSVMRFTYPYKEEYGDGLSITFCYVKDGRPYTQQVNLSKKMPDKRLKLSWSVFRDKLRPGQQEEWKLTIQKPDSTFADAELLATMYDASLDQIWKHEQLLDVHYSRMIPSRILDTYYAGNRYYNFWFKQKQYTYPQMLFDIFWMDQPGVNLQMANGGIMVRGYGSSKQMSRTGAVMLKDDMASAAESGMLLEVADLAEYSVDQDKASAVDNITEKLPEPTGDLRTNFAETAFFYPQLRTNEKGEVVVAFTMPESLTRWNFKGYAHTKGMMNGMINSQAVTSKEFMLTPNLPRFVRVGDKTSVSASVANLTENAIKGNVVFTLFDPLTEKVIAVQKQKFTAEAGKTMGVNFTFAATDKYDLLGCRIVAEGGSFSDGEQHLLPVLSNKERVIETIAMPVRGNQTREFSLAELFNNNSKTATDRSLTVEFSGNPAWYAVQALPSLSMPTNDNAISWATAYYANTLAAYIMNSQPRIKAVFDAWKKQGGTKETFLSNLQKNQDVKNILLEESPWIMEAKTEQEQKERIATLFDLNNIQNNNITALNKLNDLQLTDGSWTWYKGMNGSRYITNYVLQQLVRLSAMTGKPLDEDALAMRNRAFNYLHKEALNEYNLIRKSEQKGSKSTGVSGNTLQYLYLVAISEEAIPAGNKAAYDYFLNKVKENISSKGMVEKAVSAVILQKAGRQADAKAFIASLKEYTTQTDEQGMFFAFNEDPYSWSGLKVPAHVAVMEAMDMAGNDAAAVEEMKLWLLKQKQTQQWDSPVSTANAVYALLYRGTSLIENQGDVRITLGGKVMETLAPMNSTVPGIAYIKETITDKSDLSKIKKVVVEKRDAGIAWGAVYAQYEEDIDKVTSHSEGLQVEKKLYVERVVGDKKELLPINADNGLKVGDKVVSRITIKLDRSMDFVQLKDQRGACFEPIGNLSGYVWNRNTGYYVAVKDASTNFFFDSLSKGVYVLEHSYRVSRTGTYESGLAVIQSAYAPEYAAHSASVELNVEN